MLKSIEALPPGLYGMEIAEKKERNGKPSYEAALSNSVWKMSLRA